MAMRATTSSGALIQRAIRRRNVPHGELAKGTPALSSTINPQRFSFMQTRRARFRSGVTRKTVCCGVSMTSRILIEIASASRSSFAISASASPLRAASVSALVRKSSAHARQLSEAALGRKATPISSARGDGFLFSNCGQGRTDR